MVRILSLYVLCGLIVSSSSDVWAMKRGEPSESIPAESIPEIRSPLLSLPPDILAKVVAVSQRNALRLVCKTLYRVILIGETF